MSNRTDGCSSNTAGSNVTLAGFESAQFRNEEAVKRYFCLSDALSLPKCCIAQSLLQQAPPAHGSSDRFDFADNQIILGQRLLVLVRESLASLLHLVHSLSDQGRSVDDVLEILIPDLILCLILNSSSKSCHLPLQVLRHIA